MLGLGYLHYAARWTVRTGRTKVDILGRALILEELPAKDFFVELSSWNLH